MTPKQTAELGVARLSLPIPMAKLMTIQALADALLDGSTKEHYAQAIVEWLRTRRLESECLEALCSLLISGPDRELVDRIGHAIASPSIASDMLLSLAAGSPVTCTSWTNRHSGPVPHSLSLDAEKRDLGSGTFVPPIFTDELEALQNQSGLPFIRQWAFEYKVLSERCNTKGDGHLSYFCGQEHDNVGQLVARRSHLARSAYLRVLAYAHDEWNMPESLARQYASIAYPSEPLFLRLPPQSPPSWAAIVQSQTVAQIATPETMVATLIERIEREEQRQVMHCSLTVVNQPLCHAELEVFAIARVEDELDPEQAVHFHRHRLCTVTPYRDGLRAFISPAIDSNVVKKLGFVPLTLPLLGPHLGYLQSDLAGRVPYVPFSCKNRPKLELAPESDGAVFRLGKNLAGVWRWWLWDWKPTHPRDWSTPIGCYSSVTKTVLDQFVTDLGGPVEHVWELTIWERDKEYEKWRRKQLCGRLRSVHESQSPPSL